MNGVVVDLSPHPAVSWAVILRSQLLPIRFAKEAEALAHLGAMLSSSAEFERPQRAVIPIKPERASA